MKKKDVKKKMALYWKNETTGTMKIILNKFFTDTLLSSEELEILKRYTIQFIDAMLVKPRHYQFKIANMNQSDLIHYFHELTKMGIDPF